jgi:hypothetical protein
MCAFSLLGVPICRYFAYSLANFSNASATEKMRNEYGSARDESFTALHAAIEVPDPERRLAAVMFLLENGADVEAKKRHLKNYEIKLSAEEEV